MNLVKHLWGWRDLYAKFLLSMPVIAIFYCISRFSEEDSWLAEQVNGKLDVVMGWTLPSEEECDRYLEEVGCLGL